MSREQMIDEAVRRCLPLTLFVLRNGFGNYGIDLENRRRHTFETRAISDATPLLPKIGAEFRRIMAEAA